MGYYVRALCTSGRAPAISDLIAWLDECGFEAKAVMDNPNDRGSPDWQSFDLLYDPDKQPIPVECNRNTGEGSLAHAEAREFLDELEEVEDSPAKQVVVDHLQRLRFVVCCQLLSDIEEDGYEVNGAFLDYFVHHCGAIIQADGEGFYSDSETVLLDTSDT